MNEREIFTAASLLEDSELRTSFLAVVCQGDAARRQRIESLLQASENAGAIIGRSKQTLQHLAEICDIEESEGQPESNSSESSKEFVAPGVLQPGTQIGLYQIQQLLGEGGMGVVYAAKQTEPVKRQVALKILRPGDTSRNVLARFEQERHALAMMEHTGIARILDAGSTPEGLPYFVMELVKGIPINQFCDQENLSPQERLQLFIPVCAAVQHAHQKGIIHRDLKPSNILIALYDGKPVPKVIDFGVAKALGTRLSDASVYTEIGSVVGTLEYMAPEQAELNNLDIDTRADIYSLGVVLYELLTGSPPFSRQQLRSAAFDEMLRIIREVDPPKPSTKVSSSAEAASVAAHRKLEPKQLAKALSGDLDWVVMKSLAKERTQRYQTVGEFSADIHRFLSVEPVAAGPPSFAYRARRFLKRNKVLSIATLIALLAIIAGGVAAAWGYLESDRQFKLAKLAETEERRSRQLAETRLTQVENGIQILADVFDDLNPESNNETSGDLRNALVEQLKQAAHKLETESVGDSVAVARLQYRMALALMGLGDPKSAMEAVQSAELKFQETGDGDSDLLNCVEVKAMCLRRLGRNQEALEVLAVLLDAKRKQLGPAHVDTIATINNLGLVYANLGDSIQALAHYQEAFELCKKQYGEEAPVTLTTAFNLASTRLKFGDIKNAPADLEQVLEKRKKVLGDEHPETVNSMQSLVAAFRLNGEPKRALPIVDQVVEITRRNKGNDHPDTITAISNQALILKEIGEIEKAIPLLEQVERFRRLKLGADHPETLKAINSLAVAYKDGKRMEQAIPLYLESFDRHGKILGAEHPDTLVSMNNLGTMYVTTKEYDKALPLLEKCLTLRTKVLGEDNRMVGISLLNLGQVYQQMGQLEKAEEVYRKSLAQRERTLGPNHPSVLNAMYSLAIPLRRQEKYDEAISLIETVLERSRQLKEGLPKSMELLPEMLAEVYSEAGRLEQAETLIRGIVETYQKQSGKGSPRALLAQLSLGNILLKQNKLEQGEAVLRENLDLRVESQPDDWQTFIVRGLLGSLLLKKQEFAEAEVLIKASLEGLEARITTIPPASRETRIKQAKGWLADLYRATNRVEEAEPLDPPSAPVSEDR